MSTIKMPNIEFSLNTVHDFDEESKAWVGYIPALRLFAQAKTEERLEKSLCQTAMSFIGLCWHRKIIDRVMRDRGMRKSSVDGSTKAREVGAQYIIIGGKTIDANVERDVYGVPVSLLAGKQATIECLH